MTDAVPPRTDRERITGLLRGADGVDALILAPMADLSHAGMRTLVDEFGGCDLFFSEMISAESLVRGTQYERYYLMDAPDPSRLVFQLVGYTEEVLVEAAASLATSRATGIDINMGCSAPQIVRKGGGIAWMEDADRAAHLMDRMRRVVRGKTLSAKLRLGRDEDPERLLTFAHALESAGADFITLHPKTRKEGSARRARWSSVRMLRDRLSIPVVGNGGVVGFESLEARVREGGPGPVMIGRAAVRSPWIFAYLRHRASGASGRYHVDLIATAHRFFELLEAWQPRDFRLTRARRFIPYFMSNLKFGHTLGARLEQAHDYETAKSELFSYLDASSEVEGFAESS